MEMPTDIASMIEEHLGQVVRLDGFEKGSGLIWRRQINPFMHVIEPQNRSDGLAQCVNLGVHLSFLPVCGGSEPVMLKTLAHADCEIKARLGWEGESEDWWDCTSEIDSLTSRYRECGRTFFEKFSIFPEPFMNVEPSQLEEDQFVSAFPTMTRVRKALLFARVHDFLGNADQVLKFCEYGKSVARHAVGPKAAFRDLTRKYT